MFNSVSGTSVNKGISGLASGMDTDSLVTGLTSNTTNKIDSKMQEKQLIDWKRDAYRTLTGGLTEFNNKYFSYSSSSNILSAGFFQSYGVNNLSSHVKLSGKIENAKNVIINDIEQLATKSRYTANQFKADGNLKGDFSEVRDTSDLAGKSFSLTVGSKSYNLTISNEFGKNINSTSAPKQKSEALQKELQRLINAHGELKGKTQVEVDEGGKLSISSTNFWQKVGLSGAESDLKLLGFEKNAEGLGSVSNSESIDFKEVFQEKTLLEQVDGKSMTFNLNGIAKTITFDKAKMTDPAGTDDGAKLQSYLTKELNKVFGNGAVTAEVTGIPGDKRTLAFKVADKSSALTLTSTQGLFGKGNTFDMAQGSSNKINSNMTLEQLGIQNLETDKYQSVSFVSNDFVKDDKLTQDLEMILSDGSVLSARAGDSIDALDAKLRANQLGMSIAQDPITDDFTFTFVALDQTKTFKDGGTKVGDQPITDPSLSGEFSNGLYTLNINDVDIQVSGGQSIGKMLTAISQSEAGVNVSFSSLTDTFVFEAKDSGANGRIDFGGDAAAIGPNSLAAKLFGVGVGGVLPSDKVIQGQNSIVDLTINGVQQRVERTTNMIAVDGLNIELVSKDESGNAYEKFTMVAADFGQGHTLNLKGGGSINLDAEALAKLQETPPNADYLKGLKDQGVKLDIVNGQFMFSATDAGKAIFQSVTGGDKAAVSKGLSGLVGVQENISFDVTNDVDKVMKNIKDFVESYNAVIASITGAIEQQIVRDGGSERKYEPLTDAQKKDMTEDQIKTWETEAKKGVLFNDGTLKKIQQDMRSALYAPVAGASLILSDIGIKTGDWAQKGKLEIDETKLKKALLEKPDQVAALFTQKSEVDYAADLKGEKRTQRYKESGLMERIGDTLKFAVATTTPKGVLLEIAGMKNDRTDGENSLQKQGDELSGEIKELQRRLKTEQERYYKQFAAMEKYINQMNQQSSWLSQQLGS